MFDSLNAIVKKNKQNKQTEDGFYFKDSLTKKKTTTVEN